MICERLVVCRLAAAEVEGAARLCREALGGEAGALVRAIAIRLLLGFAACAPKVGFARLQRDLVRALLGANRLIGHRVFPLALPRRR